METIKKESKQALLDKKCVLILKDDNSTPRDKERAFNELYSRHNQQVRIYFIKRLRDSDVAEDLLIISFQKVHEYIKSYDNKYAFSTWLYKIANNSLIDYTRKAKFEVFSLDALTEKALEGNGGNVFQIDSGSLNPENLMINSELSKKINIAINSLDSKIMRDVVTYRFIYGMSFYDISTKLGLDTKSSTVRTLLRRGRILLIENLK